MVDGRVFPKPDFAKQSSGMTDSPTAAVDAAGRVQFFYRGTDQAAWRGGQTEDYQTFTTAASLAGQILKRPTAALGWDLHPLGGVGPAAASAGDDGRTAAITAHATNHLHQEPTSKPSPPAAARTAAARPAVRAKDTTCG